MANNIPPAPPMGDAYYASLASQDWGDDGLYYDPTPNTGNPSPNLEPPIPHDTSEVITQNGVTTYTHVNYARPRENKQGNNQGNGYQNKQGNKGKNSRWKNKNHQKKFEKPPANIPPNDDAENLQNQQQTNLEQNPEQAPNVNPNKQAKKASAFDDEVDLNPPSKLAKNFQDVGDIFRGNPESFANGQKFDDAGLDAEIMVQKILSLADDMPHGTDLHKVIDNYINPESKHQVYLDKHKDNTYEIPNKKHNFPKYADPSTHYTLTNKLTYEVFPQFMADVMGAMRKGIRQQAFHGELKDEHLTKVIDIMGGMKKMVNLQANDIQNKQLVKDILEPIDKLEKDAGKNIYQAVDDKELIHRYVYNLNHAGVNEALKQAQQKKQDIEAQIQQQSSSQTVNANVANPMTKDNDNAPYLATDGIPLDEKSAYEETKLEMPIAPEKQTSAVAIKNTMDKENQPKEEYEVAELDEALTDNASLSKKPDKNNFDESTKDKVAEQVLDSQNAYLTHPTPENKKLADTISEQAQHYIDDLPDYLEKSNNQNIQAKRQQTVDLLNDLKQDSKNEKIALASENLLFGNILKPQNANLVSAPPSNTPSAGMGMAK